MHIVHVATEFATVAKIGGLGDVTYGLSLELVRLGHQVTIILPKFDIIDVHNITDFKLEKCTFTSFFENNWYPNSVWTGQFNGVRLFFIDSHHPHHFFNRGLIYGADDDVNRFLYFSRAVYDLFTKWEMGADVIHVHDWHCAAFIPLYKTLFSNNPVKVILTLHNLEYQGRCSPEEISKIGLEPNRFFFPEQMQDSIYHEAANLLKGGIVNADEVTTVSPNYMKEILFGGEGKGLENIINQYQYKFSGILNGIDPNYWNPEIDPYLPVHFSEKKPKNKELVKQHLLNKLGMSEENSPLIGVVTRLVPQKGIELIKEALDYTLKNGGQFILLGSTTVLSIQEDFEKLKLQHIDNPHVYLQLHHDEEIAHLIYAASDLLLMPSIFEPCGLSQLIALRYGTLPIARRTGGLIDTVFDQVNGFTFNEPTSESLHQAMDRAFWSWRTDPFKWKMMMQNAMKAPFNWKESAKKYLDIYSSKIISKISD